MVLCSTQQSFHSQLFYVLIFLLNSDSRHCFRSLHIYLVKIHETEK